MLDSKSGSLARIMTNRTPLTLTELYKTKPSLFLWDVFYTINHPALVIGLMASIRLKPGMLMSVYPSLIGLSAFWRYLKLNRLAGTDGYGNSFIQNAYGWREHKFSCFFSMPINLSIFCPPLILYPIAFLSFYTIGYEKMWLLIRWLYFWA